jgi:KDO2-lipid IV(A) lauroyltransferase
VTQQAARTDEGLTVRWHARGLNNGLIFAATYHGVTRLPRRCSYGIGHVGTWIAYHLMRDGTRALVENFRVVKPQASERELERLALRTYRSYARDTIDFIRGLSFTRDEFEPLVAELHSDRFDELLAEGRGVILVGGHFGNWELGGLALRLLRGYPLTVVGRPEPSPIVNEFRRRMRDGLGIETLQIGRMLDTALQIRRALAENGVVAMLLDRHLGRDQIEVTFFGRPALFLRSPAMIAYLSGAPLLPSFMIRQPDGRFAGVCGDPIRPNPSLSPDESVMEMTQAFAAELERRIREHPHLWYQFYPYWQG